MASQFHVFDSFVLLIFCWKEWPDQWSFTTLVETRPKTSRYFSSGSDTDDNRMTKSTNVLGIQKCNRKSARRDPTLLPPPKPPPPSSRTEMHEERGMKVELGNSWVTGCSDYFSLDTNRAGRKGLGIPPINSAPDYSLLTFINGDNLKMVFNRS